MNAIGTSVKCNGLLSANTLRSQICTSREWVLASLKIKRSIQHKKHRDLLRIIDSSVVRDKHFAEYLKLRSGVLNGRAKAKLN